MFMYALHAVPVWSLTILLLAGLLAIGNPSQLKKPDVPRVVEAAAASTNVWEAGSSAFYVRARMKVHGLEVGSADGTYRLTWVSPEQWREEISIADYHELRIADRDKMWLSRNLDFMPLRVYEMRKLICFNSHIRVDKRDRVRRLRKIKEFPNSNCVDLGPDWANIRTICFGADGNLQLIRYGWRLYTDYQFGDYAPLGDKNYPRKISYSDSGKPALDVEIQEMGILKDLASDLFEPPSNALRWDWCAKPNLPVSTRNVNYYPIYDAASPFYRTTWRAVFYTLLDIDGRFKNTRFLIEPSQPIADGILRTAATELYKPASCGDKSIPIERVIDLGYTCCR